MSYSFLKSLTTYYVLHLLHLNAELKGVFTEDAIAKTSRETYDHTTQEFETEDLELYKDLQEDFDDDSLDFLQFDDDELNTINLDIEANLPEVIGENKMINCQGHNDAITASSIGTIGTKVSFAKTDCYPDEDGNSTIPSKFEATKANPSISQLEATLKASIESFTNQDTAFQQNRTASVK